ncbi:MAG: hypothetical protein SWO11_04550 [Thermodesulfobacteriota bacterium]|nr:hypothetical protein [Thermodesulfobacteriota bacterium]
MHAWGFHIEVPKQDFPSFSGKNCACICKKHCPAHAALITVKCCNVGRVFVHPVMLPLPVEDISPIARLQEFGMRFPECIPCCLHPGKYLFPSHLTGLYKL